MRQFPRSQSKLQNNIFNCLRAGACALYGPPWVAFCPSNSHFLGQNSLNIAKFRWLLGLRPRPRLFFQDVGGPLKTWPEVPPPLFWGQRKPLLESIFLGLFRAENYETLPTSGASPQTPLTLTRFTCSIRGSHGIHARIQNLGGPVQKSCAPNGFRTVIFQNFSRLASLAGSFSVFHSIPGEFHKIRLWKVKMSLIWRQLPLWGRKGAFDCILPPARPKKFFFFWSRGGG